jgi:hypothetical protein
MMGKTLLLAIAVCMVGCGGDSGEPIEGTITIGYGDDMITPDVGAALHEPDSPPNLMFIIIGTNAVDCGIDFETFDARGTFVLFDVDNTAPATHNDTSISVVRNTSNSFSLNGSFGTVVIDSIGTDRVTGSVTFSTTDEEVGAITAMGTFDVARCF